jgi:hypothetical protein
MAMKRWIEKDVTFKGNPPWLEQKPVRCSKYSRATSKITPLR